MSGYDIITRDLARKAGDDATAAVYRTLALHDDLAAKSMIATMAAGQTLAIAAAMLAAKMKAQGLQREGQAEAVIDAPWSIMRPIALDSVKNGPGHDQ